MIHNKLICSKSNNFLNVHLKHFATPSSADPSDPIIHINSERSNFTTVLSNPVLLKYQVLYGPRRIARNKNLILSSIVPRFYDNV